MGEVTIYCVFILAQKAKGNSKLYAIIVEKQQQQQQQMSNWVIIFCFLIILSICSSNKSSDSYQLSKNDGSISVGCTIYPRLL